MITEIYVLKDECGQIRYLGKTILPLQKRLSIHLSDAKKGHKNHRCYWVRNMQSRGLTPAIMSIGSVEGNGCREEMAWIAYLKEEGFKLTNGTLGGEGTLGYKHSLERRMKISNVTRGRTHIASAETRAKMSQSMKGRIFSQAHRLNLSIALTGKKLSPGHCASISRASKGRVISPETRAKMSLAQRARFNKGLSDLFGNPVKLCNTCHNEKPLSEFGLFKNRMGLDSCKSSCKICLCKKQKEYALRKKSTIISS